MHPVVRLTGLLAAAALTVTTAACGGGDDADDDRTATDRETTATDSATEGTDLSDLAGRTLVVTEIEVDGERREVAEGTQIRFRFGKANVQVETGCNGLGGAWERTDDRLDFGALMGTMMACEEPLMGQETWLRELLEQPVTVAGDTFVVDDTVLTLADREVVSPDLELAGQRWRLTSLIDADAVSSVPRGVRAWLEYDGARLVVNTGCNRATLPAEFDADTLSVGDKGATTLRGCPGDAGDVEKAVLAVLDGQVSVEIEERSLTLTGPDGTGLGFTARK